MAIQPEGGQDHALACPKCGTQMDRISHANVEVDRCTLCKGIWFDPSEVDALRELAGAEAIDVGDARVGRAMDGQTGVDCPVCRIPLQRVPDAKQPHVWTDRCPGCKGMFFDAGEFRDLTNDDVFELFDRLLDEADDG